MYIDRIVSYVYLTCILEYSDLFVGGADIVDLLMSLLDVLVKFYDTCTCTFGYVKYFAAENCGQNLVVALYLILRSKAILSKFVTRSSLFMIIYSTIVAKLIMWAVFGILVFL